MPLLTMFLMLASLLGACSMQNEWKGGPDEYMQLYEGPKRPATSVARVRMAEPNFKFTYSDPFFMAVSGTALSRAGDIYATKRFEVLPGKYKIDVSLIGVGSVNSPLDDRWYENGDGTIEAELEAGHLYEVTLSDEGTKFSFPARVERYVWVNLDDITTKRPVIIKQGIAHYWPRLGRGQTPPSQGNIFQRIDSIPGGTKVTVVETEENKGTKLITRIITPEGMTIAPDAKVIHPKLLIDEDHIKARTADLTLRGEIKLRFDVSEVGEISNVRVIDDVNTKLSEVAKQLVHSSSAEPGVIDDKPAAFKDVEAKISFDETGKAGKTLLKVAVGIVLVPIAIIFGLTSGGGFHFDSGN